MLWKKESKKPDAFYVDLLAPGLDHWESKLNASLAALDQTPHPKKSDAIAQQKRNEGNVKFRAREYVDAMDLYGNCLRYAQPKSEHISLAYANRAACFLSLKMYENCLKDIELATEAGYPEHLMPKLEERKKICLKQMHDDPQPERKLLAAHAQFPCLTNALAEVRTSENDGENSIVAKTDIDVGQIIVIEDSFQKYLLKSFGSTCNSCLKENLVPCKNCAHAMFCPECQGDSLHDHECGLNYCGENAFNRVIMEGVRGILQMLKVFPNVDDLMTIVEQCQNNPIKWPANLLDEQSKYQLFFGNMDRISGKIHPQASEIIYPVYKTLLQITQINEMFQSTKHQRFLMHAIAHKTIWEVYETASARYNKIMDKYFKHSCNPNLLRLGCDGKSIYYSIKLIKRGEQLNTCCISLGIDSIQERQTEFSELGYEKCECPRCSGKVSSSALCHRMATDATYKRIVNNIKLMRINIKKINPSLMMDDCATFLRKYGRMHWCKELGSMTRLFHRLYDISLTEDFEHPMARAHLEKCVGELCELFNMPY